MSSFVWCKKTMVDQIKSYTVCPEYEQLSSFDNSRLVSDERERTSKWTDGTKWFIFHSLFLPFFFLFFFFSCFSSDDENINEHIAETFFSLSILRDTFRYFLLHLLNFFLHFWFMFFLLLSFQFYFIRCLSSVRKKIYFEMRRSVVASSIGAPKQ